MYFFSTEKRVHARGFMMVELLVGAALLVIVFTGLIAAFKFSLAVLLQTRYETGAVAIANERMEYLRSLPYDSVGTAGGIPTGTIAQNESITLNGLTYNRRTFIEYKDSPDDGLGASDSNGITADYKVAKVEVTWTQGGVAHSIFIVSNIIPKSIESLAGGGTLIVNVFNSAAVPIDSANVRIVNNSATSAIDVTANTNSAGQVIFPGAPAGGGYQISVTDPGYSSAQTYSASTTNPNPNPSHIAVTAGLVSTINFSIDLVGQLTVRTVAPPQTFQNQDTFANASKLASTSSTTVFNSALILATSSLGYSATGTAYATATAPSGIVGWRQAQFTQTVPVSTSINYHIYSVDALGVRTLIPDGNVAGNAAGLTSSPIDLSSIPASSYPQLAIGATLTTASTTITPSIQNWLISYDTANVGIPSIAFTISGAKNIGTDSGGQPVLKYTSTQSTNASGSTTIPNLESDTYSISVNGVATDYDISDVCPRLPFVLSPGSSTSTSLILSAHTDHSLRVFVTTSAGAVLPGADVHVTSGGYDKTVTTSTCGSSFFSGLTSGSNYTVTASKSGYTSDTLNNVSVSGATTLPMTLAP